MSGQQWGSAIGGIIGSFWGPVGYAIGSAIGGAIGGYIDPTIIKGPRLSDAMAQTAQDGIPIPFGFGTFPTAGNIIFASPLRERKKEDNGKGTGIVNVTYHYYRSYAIGICQGIRQDDGTYLDIAGVLQVKRNGKVVYNTLPSASAEEQAGNAKFLKKARFYLGGETQLPDSTMEGFKGAGNVPAYRGLVYMVVNDEELTEMGGAIPQFEFVVVMEGDVQPYHSESLLPAMLGRFQDSVFPLRDPESFYTYQGYWISGNGSGQTSPEFDTVQEVQDWVQGLDAQTGAPGENSLGTPNFYIGYYSQTSGQVGDYSSTTAEISKVTPQYDPTYLSTVYLVYQFFEPDLGWSTNNTSEFCLLLTPGSDWAGSGAGYIVREVTSHETPYLPIANCGGTGIDGISPLVVTAIRKVNAPYEDPPPLAVELPDEEGYWVLPTGEVVFVPTFVPVTGTFKSLSTDSTLSTIDGRSQYSWFGTPPTLASTDPNYSNQFFWESAYSLAEANGSVPSGWVYGVDYPTIHTDAYQSDVTDSQVIDRHIVPVAGIVGAICKRSGLTEDDYDVSSVTDLVDGFKVATEGSGEAFIAPLMNGFFFDAGEWDDRVRFIKRGGDVLGELGPNDMCERDGQVIEETQLQEVELLRKINVKALDPDAGFNITTQTWERRTTLVKAKGEQTTEIPVVIDHDTQARMAAKKGKVGWSETRKFNYCLPYIFPQYTVTDRVGLTDSKGRRQRTRLMEMGEQSGQIEITESMLDRQSSYTSNVQGITHNPPSDTGSGLIGPTFFVAMNLNSLRSADNVPGMYIAGTGVLSGWNGYALQISVDGGTTFQTVLDYVEGADMGALTEDLAAAFNSSGESDPVYVYMYAGQLVSIQPEQIADRFNAFAITTEGVSEVGQFINQSQDSAGIYELTDVFRARNGSVIADHFVDDTFVMLATATFLPLDISLAGKTILFRPVSIGTAPENNPVYSFVFNPQFTGPPVISFLLTDTGDNIITNTGEFIQVKS